MDTKSWYLTLNKPSWAPDESLFGKVWSGLYPVIIAVNIYVVVLLIQSKISWLIALPFWLNLFFNLLFTPIQFVLRNNWLAAADIYLILTTIIWAMVATWPYAKFATIAFVPYLIWVCIAAVLQTYIALHN